MFNFIKKRKKCNYENGEFIKLDTYLFKLKNDGKVSVVMRNGEPWFKLDDYYFYKGRWGNFIRKGSMRESDTIYKGSALRESEWLISPDKEIINLFEAAIDYWDLNIG